MEHSEPFSRVGIEVPELNGFEGPFQPTKEFTPTEIDTTLSPEEKEKQEKLTAALTEDLPEGHKIRVLTPEELDEILVTDRHFYHMPKATPWEQLTSWDLPALYEARAENTQEEPIEGEAGEPFIQLAYCPLESDSWRAAYLFPGRQMSGMRFGGTLLDLYRPGPDSPENLLGELLFKLQNHEGYCKNEPQIIKWVRELAVNLQRGCTRILSDSHPHRTDSILKFSQDYLAILPSIFLPRIQTCLRILSLRACI